MNKFRLHRLNKLNWFENVPFNVWHNPQELPQVNHILGFQKLSVDVSLIFSKVFSNNVVCGIKWTCCLPITS